MLFSSTAVLVENRSDPASGSEGEVAAAAGKRAARVHVSPGSSLCSNDSLDQPPSMITLLTRGYSGYFGSQALVT